MTEKESLYKEKEDYSNSIYYNPLFYYIDSLFLYKLYLKLFYQYL